MEPPTAILFDQNAKLNLDTFLKSFKIYLQTTGLSEQDDETKVAIFLNHAGEEALKKFEMFKLSEKEINNYESVVNAFKNYCKPLRNETYDRFKFFTRSQREGEDFDHFVTDVKTLARECNFECLEDSLIRDKIICGINDLSLRDRLLRVPELSLANAEKHCRAAEASKHQAKGLPNIEVNGKEVDALWKGNDETQDGNKNGNRSNGKDEQESSCNLNDCIPIKMENMDIELEGLHHSIDIKEEILEYPVKVECKPKKKSNKKFTCSTCGFSSAVKGNFTKHLKIHGQKPFTCDICDYRSSRKENLRTHMRTHTGERPFKCEICNYRCALKDSLNKHSRKHTGEKPYRCEVCNYECAHKSSLSHHLVKHFGKKDSEDKLFKCDICNYSSALRSALSKHLRTHTVNASTGDRSR